MPELPEVETMRRGVLRVMGATISRATVPQLTVHPIKYSPAPEELCRRLTGRTLQAAERAGKRLLLHLDSTDVLVIEPRMTGRVMIDPPGGLSHVRLQLDLVKPLSGQAAEKHVLIYRDVRGLGVVRLLPVDQCRRELGPNKLGPDALDITWQQLRDRLSHRHCAIKVALLDQKALAGVGNIYASEALHRARIHPAMPCSLLKRSQWQRLTICLQQVLEEAIRLQGSTLDDGAYTTPENTPGNYQDKHRVYQRDGLRCYQCQRGLIRRSVLGQRSTFFCPVCQRPPRAK